MKKATTPSGVIRLVLELNERSNIELQNIRDMVVMLYGDWIRNATLTRTVEDLYDAMSAITCVIDTIKFERGLEV